MLIARRPSAFKVYEEYIEQLNMTCWFDDDAKFNAAD
jgi:hypothetical protein